MMVITKLDLKKKERDREDDEEEEEEEKGGEEEKHEEIPSLFGSTLLINLGIYSRFHICRMHYLHLLDSSHSNV